jgi:hypothetical protein
LVVAPCQFDSSLLLSVITEYISWLCPCKAGL